ncbi:hypothetical protein FOL47_009622 [Perkinsus chesapeaki]|uniref:Uncharacterized protein n=1 Tax=Perkinsus chesapeaki TaxID=330153 RepID=A0A7J6L769_PERCH|nr:hypothetical protein FOL47_009622 [Perkinsus chesapeaki]
MIRALFMWSICWCIGYSGHHKPPISDGVYCNRKYGAEVHFAKGIVSPSLDGEKITFGQYQTDYKCDKKTGFITINSRALRKDGYKSFPYVKPLWNLTYVKAKDEVLLNYPKAKEPIRLTKGGCSAKDNRNVNHFHHKSESGSLSGKTFCVPPKKKKKTGVYGIIEFVDDNGPSLSIDISTLDIWMRWSDDYVLRDGPSEELKRVWSETMDNYTTLDVSPFMEFSTEMYYNTKLDVIIISRKSSKDHWILEPSDPKKCYY